MRKPIIRDVSSSTMLACALALTLAGCERGAEIVRSPSSDEMAWARAALERNPELEVIASDTDSAVITVRMRGSGEVQALKLDELVAGPVSQFSAAARQPSAAPASGDAQPGPAPQPAAPAPSTREQAAPPSASTPPSSETSSRETRDQQQGRERLASRPSGAEPATGVPGYTIERENGQLRVSGPGVSIVSSGIQASAEERERSSTPASEPIICEGPRMLHLDARTMYVDGDAIIARGGCELHITNSRIVASGTGLVVEDATVHVSNSYIEGAQGAFEASDRARLFVRGSTFEGVPRRTDLAMVTDQGGNRWQ
ncbi:MAG TPA: hypothetical protein VF161_10750 [Steroidobacteraceae bacterium]